MTAWKTWSPPPNDIHHERDTGRLSHAKERFLAVRLNSLSTAEPIRPSRQSCCRAEPFMRAAPTIGRVFASAERRLPRMLLLTGRSGDSAPRKAYSRWSGTWTALLRRWAFLRWRFAAEIS